MLKTPDVVLGPGFLHLELGYHIHKDHNERMQETILFKVEEMVICAVMIQCWLVCKSGCICSLHVAPSSHHNSLPRHIAK